MMANRQFLIQLALVLVLAVTSLGSVAQTLNKQQLLNQLNSIIRAKGVAVDTQTQQLDTLIASANALRADSVENALRAYKMLVNAENGNFESVKSDARLLLSMAIRSQDYRSQAHVLRALIAYQSVTTPADVQSSKQQLLSLLARRLTATDKAQILFAIGQADTNTGNVMSALDFLMQAEDAFWQQSDYAQWRQSIELQVALLLDMNWFNKAQQKQQQLVDFLYSQSGNIPFNRTDELLHIMAANNQWTEIEDKALNMLSAAAEKNNIPAQFIAGYWLMNVNLEKQNWQMVARWYKQLDNWLAEHPALQSSELLTLNKVAYHIAQQQISQAEALQRDISVEQLQAGKYSYLTIRRHLYNQIALARAQQQLEVLESTYQALLAWVDTEGRRVMSLTMGQISEDFATMQQSTQKEIIALSKSLATEKERVKKESLFNNLLIGLVGGLLVIIATLSYYYIRLKNQKQSQRRRRRLSSRH